MDMPLNTFKRALAAGETQIGLFLGLANRSHSADGWRTQLDWRLIDGGARAEHRVLTHGQLQALAVSGAASGAHGRS